MDIGYTHHVRIRAILRVSATIAQCQTDNTVINGDQQIPLLKRIMDFICRVAAAGVPLVGQLVPTPGLSLSKLTLNHKIRAAAVATLACRQVNPPFPCTPQFSAYIL